MRYLFLHMKDRKIFVASLPALCYTCVLAGGVFRIRVIHSHILSTHALPHAPTLGSFELPYSEEMEMGKPGGP